MILTCAVDKNFKLWKILNNSLQNIDCKFLWIFITILISFFYLVKVFVYENDVRYGIYNCDAETEQIDVFFETKQMDNYTISVEADGKFESVILVDCASGVETNVLLEDYSFMSSSQRFVLKIRQQSKVHNQSLFAYMSGNELIIEAQGLIQIFDVMGRIHYSDEMTDDKNRIDLSSYMSGTYMVRVVDGDNVRTEKIVVY